MFSLRSENINAVFAFVGPFAQHLLVLFYFVIVAAVTVVAVVVGKRGAWLCFIVAFEIFF